MTSNEGAPNMGHRHSLTIETNPLHLLPSNMRRFSQAESLRHPSAPLLAKLGKSPPEIPAIKFEIYGKLLLNYSEPLEQFLKCLIDYEEEYKDSNFHEDKMATLRTSPVMWHMTIDPKSITISHMNDEFPRSGHLTGNRVSRNQK